MRFRQIRGTENLGLGEADFLSQPQRNGNRYHGLGGARSISGIGEVADSVIFATQSAIIKDKEPPARASTAPPHRVTPQLGKPE
jgi:hypothetical protein